MSGVTIGEATLSDVIDVAGGRGWLVWRVLRHQWAHSQSFAFHAGGELVAIAGLYNLAGNEAEAWFNFTPQAAPALLGIARLTRLTLAAQTYVRIICLCTSKQGARFAALSGFKLKGPHEFGELWER